MVLNLNLLPLVSQEALRIQKAEDIGRQAYKVGAAISSHERVRKGVIESGQWGSRLWQQQENRASFGLPYC
jgi:hypothetical protein